MASPVVEGTTEGGLTSAGTNLAVTLPAGGSETDLYLVIIAKGSAAVTINALTDWSEVLDENVANGLAIIWYTGSGVPSNPTFVQSSSSRSVWGAYRISGANKSITPQVGTTATGTSTTPDPPSVTVTGGPKDILAIACFAAAGELADNDTLVTTFPTNYTDGQIEKTGGTTGTNLAGLLGAAARQAAAASSENPGTFTQNASRAWRAQTIIVHPVVVTTTAVAEISLGSISTPQARTDHKIKVRARVQSGAGTLKAALYQGSENISGDLETAALTTSLADYTLSIPNDNAAGITDYSNLSIRFWGSASGSVTFEVDQIWLQTPPAPAGGGSSTPQGISTDVTLAASISMRVVRAVPMSVALNMNPAISKKFIGYRNLNATVTMGASITRLKNAPRTLSVTVTMGATLTKSAVRPKAISAGVTLTPTISAFKTFPRSLPVTVTFGTTLSKQYVGSRNLPVTLTLTPTISRFRTAVRTLPVTLTMSPTISKQLIAYRSLIEQLDMNPTLAKQAVRPKLISLAVALVPNLIPGKLFLRTLGPVTMAFTPSIVRASGFVKSLPVTLTFAPTMTRRKIAVRSLPVTVTLTPVISRQSIRYRALVPSFTVTPALAQQLIARRTLSTGLVLSPSMLRAYPKVLQAALTLSAALSPVSGHSQSLSVTVSMAPSIAKGNQYVKTLTTALTLDPALVAFFERSRQLSVVLDMNPVIVAVPSVIAAEFVEGMLMGAGPLPTPILLGVTEDANLVSTDPEQANLLNS